MPFWISYRVYLTNNFNELFPNRIVLLGLHKYLSFCFFNFFYIRQFFFKIYCFGDKSASVSLDKHQLKNIELLKRHPIFIKFL